MNLSTRLTRLEVALRREDREPALVVVIEDSDGRLVDATGNEVDPGALSPWTQLITITERSDGPQ